jgi:hypothetical protein
MVSGLSPSPLQVVDSGVHWNARTMSEATLFKPHTPFGGLGPSVGTELGNAHVMGLDVRWLSQSGGWPQLC